VKINNNINNNKVKPSQRSNITLNSIIVNNNDEFNSKIIKLNTDINNKQIIVLQKSNNTKKTNIINNIHVKNNILSLNCSFSEQSNSEDSSSDNEDSSCVGQDNSINSLNNLEDPINIKTKGRKGNRFQAKKSKTKAKTKSNLKRKNIGKPPNNLKRKREL